MLDPKWIEAPDLRAPTGAAGMSACASGGSPMILVESATGVEGWLAMGPPKRAGDPPPAHKREADGIVGAVADALAGSRRGGVLIVEARPARSDLDPARERPAPRGVWELLREAYLCDLASQQTAQFGLGDWLEILSAQGRTGELVVDDGRGSFRVHLVAGSIRALECPASGAAVGLAPSELRARASESIVRLIEVGNPTCRFVERSDPPTTAAGGSAGDEQSHLDRLIREPLGVHLRSPFLASRIASHLTETSRANPKRLAAGGGALTPALHRPFQFLLRRLGRGFDVVLIDAPIASRAELTGALAGLTDVVLLVASASDVDSRAVFRAVDELRRAGARVVAALSDRAETSKATPPIH